MAAGLHRLHIRRASDNQVISERPRAEILGLRTVIPIAETVHFKSPENVQKDHEGADIKSTLFSLSLANGYSAN